MSNIVNGTGHPIIRIYNGSNWYSFELSNCDSSGLKEKKIPERIIHKLWNGEIVPENYGYHIQFYLNYDELSDKINSLKIAELKNLILNDSNIIWLTPRSNLPQRNFEVVEITEDFEMGLENNSEDSLGNTGLHLVFQTKYRQTKYNWIDPDNVGIVFDDFVVI
jgi:hypothetical protein